MGDKDQDELRYILRKHRLGVNLTEGNVKKYMMYHRFLTVEEMARRMHDTGLFLDIFDEGAKLNTKEEWEKTLRRRVPHTLKGEGRELYSGVFLIRKDPKFPGGFRVWADIGTILDSSLTVE